MPSDRSPQAIAAEFHNVLGTYQKKRRAGARHHQAFLAAVSEYSAHHPYASKAAAAHTVTQMMRDIDAQPAA